MITQVTMSTFTQVVDGETIIHQFENVEVKNKSITLPAFNSKIEILFHNNANDLHSMLVSKIFARLAVLNG